MILFRSFQIQILMCGFLWCAFAHGFSNELVHRASAVVVGPLGEVVLYTRSGNDITIKTCVDHSIIRDENDCDLAPGTQAVQIKRDVLKESFRRIVMVMPFTGDSQSENESRICIYGRNSQREVDGLRTQIKITQDFLRFYCEVESESDPCISDDDRTSVSALGEKLARLIYSKHEIITADRFVDQLLDQVIAGKALQVLPNGCLEILK
jgi:hypothetical protein